MTGSFTLAAEVVEHVGNSLAEKLFPQPVDIVSGGEGVFLGDDPVREIQAGKRAVLGQAVRRQKRQHGGFDNFTAFILPVAPFQNAGYRTFVLGHGGGSNSAGPTAPRAADFCEKVFVVSRHLRFRCVAEVKRCGRIFQRLNETWRKRRLAGNRIEHRRGRKPQSPDVRRFETSC